MKEKYRDIIQDVRYDKALKTMSDVCDKGKLEDQNAVRELDIPKK